jgi:hypothetical protein
MALPDRIQAAQPSDLGGSFGCAFVIPFLPFDIEPFGPGAGVFSNASNRSDGDSACVTADGSDPTSFGASS